MIAEIDVHGVFIPALLAWALTALPVTAFLKRLLRWLAVYRLVWHRRLFDFALFVIVLGGVTALSQWIVP
ncbi:MAG TPA: DUF1656 domain-containing protein [Dongiaceae bacterium]|nr:DUF1656 domain-containing protein [Dongiaceae bacterium]